MNLASKPPSPLEFPGPLTPPPLRNFRFPPWWGSGYFLELHNIHILFLPESQLSREQRKTVKFITPVAQTEGPLTATRIHHRRPKTTHEITYETQNTKSTPGHLRSIRVVNKSAKYRLAFCGTFLATTLRDPDLLTKRVFTVELSKKYVS